MAQSFVAPPPRSEIEVEVDAGVESTLRAEARNQGVGLAELAGHAVLVYLAEIDRIGKRRVDAGVATEGMIVPAFDVDDAAPL